MLQAPLKTTGAIARALYAGHRALLDSGLDLNIANCDEIGVFISTSQIHMEDMLRMSERQVLDAIEEGTRLAAGYTDDVGDAEANLILSEQRAQLVVDAIGPSGPLFPFARSRTRRNWRL